MDLKEAEHRYLHLKQLHAEGELDDAGLRLEAAKLLVLDDQGAYWMVDPDQGQWYCNQGTGWAEADPQATREALPFPDLLPAEKPARVHPMAILGAVLALFLIAAAVVVFQRWPGVLGPAPTPTPERAADVQVIIASPSSSSTVAEGQEVAVETTLLAEQSLPQQDLQAVDRVDLEVDGQVVESRAVGGAIQPAQSSLPLSLSWHASGMGDHDLTVVARSDDDGTLGEATVRIHVAEVPAEVLPEPACSAGAVFLSDVTIPAGTAFQPGARMDKVWQVRNSGTCAWGVGYELVMTAGDSLGTGGTAAVPTASAGDRLNLQVTLWAPMETGIYTNAWQLRTPAGIFFGPTLTVAIEVEPLAKPGEPPAVPGELQAVLAADGTSVVLTWEDRSDNEDAFRIYRDDAEASIGLVPADTTSFVDRDVHCGKTYRYRVAAFNAAGPSPSYRAAPLVMPACGEAPVE